MLEMNNNLLHLNLEFCGLFKPALRILIENIYQSDKIQCLHLTGNTEMSTDFSMFICETLDTQPIKNSETYLTRYGSVKRKMNIKKQKLNRNSFFPRKEKVVLDDESRWKQIR